MQLTDIQKKILHQFFENEFWEYDGEWRHSEDFLLITYARLTKEIGLTKERLRPDVLELRNARFIELSTGVDYDGVPCGSGYMLTDKGVEKTKELFATPNL